MNIKVLKDLIKDDSRVIFNNDIDKKYLTDGLSRDYGEADALVFVKTCDEVLWF